MQQAGATPAEAMAFTLSSAIQYAERLHRRAAWTPTQFLPRFTFFFDISHQLLRGGRQVPRRPAHLGAARARALRRQGPRRRGASSSTARPRASTSRAQQPLNNIARVTVQAMAGIFGGLQSLHTDAYDEVLSVPTEAAARIAVATQNILREEAHLTDVIDPLGGSYYVEALTDQMEAKIRAVIATIDDAGGMYAAVEAGLRAAHIGDSALAFQERGRSRRADDRRRQQVPPTGRGGDASAQALKPPPRKKIEAQIKRAQARSRPSAARARCAAALDGAGARGRKQGRERLREGGRRRAAPASRTARSAPTLRKVYGFGQPLIVA